MAKLFFEENGIRNIVIPNIENTINRIKEIKRQIANANSPVGNSYLNSCSDKVETCFQDMNMINNWLQASIDTFRSLEEEMQTNISKIEDIPLTRRTSNIIMK